jgi:hypothetical protein
MLRWLTLFTFQMMRQRVSDGLKFAGDAVQTKQAKTNLACNIFRFPTAHKKILFPQDSDNSSS